MEHILEVSNIAKKYGDFNLQNISFNVSANRIVGLIGENGAGKTTLISLILNQIKADLGNIKIFGEANDSNEELIKQKVGVVVDECCFHPTLNSKDINGIMALIYKHWDYQAFVSYLSEFSIELLKPVSKMSKGMKNKLMLAVALAHKPQFLIMDEVTSGLDPMVRDNILVILQEYVVKHNATVFFSTHITSDLDKIADDVIFLHKGNLVFYQDKKTLRKGYKFLKCDGDILKLISKQDIVALNEMKDQYFVLLKNNTDYTFPGVNQLLNPTIDDIMLLYLKGEINSERAS